MLEVGFSDGSTYRIPFELMRVYSPSAEVQGHGPGQEVLQTGKREVEVVSLEPVQESTLGITHHWVAVKVPDPSFPLYRIWFQFRRARRDDWLGQLVQICGK